MSGNVMLRHGRHVRLRSVRSEDSGLLAQGFEQLGAESRYRRFCSPVQSLSTRQLHFLSRVDHHDHEAIVAVVEVAGVESGAGVAGVVRSPNRPDEADVAVTVVDRWQGRGLGGVLLRRLAERARAEGVHRFTADVCAANAAMLHLLHALGPARTDRGGSQVAVTVELAGDRAGSAQA